MRRSGTTAESSEASEAVTEVITDSEDDYYILEDGK